MIHLFSAPGAFYQLYLSSMRINFNHHNVTWRPVPFC